MAGEKFIVAASGNPFQISVRNILSPVGYSFQSSCNDGTSLLRLVRSYNPDFAVVDMALQFRELRTTLETIDDEMLCACIAVGDYKDREIMSLLENSKALSFCPKPLSRDMLVHTIEMAIINFKRVYQLNLKLKEMTESYETRKAVERAKWILIERDGISEADAYERMRRKSMDTRLSMKAIADAIITAYEVRGRK
ncbi:MAG: ANTAR domain-containing protein [Clostridia bacterium]|nr:ANTAR domain-containing protein [Clostridia bacterium]